MFVPSQELVRSGNIVSVLDVRKLACRQANGLEKLMKETGPGLRSANFQAMALSIQANLLPYLF